MNLVKGKIRMAESSSALAYRRSRNGLIRRAYVKMKQRISGRGTSTPQLYLGLDLLSLQDFFSFSMTCLDLMKIHGEWVKSGYDKCLTPSIDRIDTSKGYILENIRWITKSENSKRVHRKGA